MKDNAILKSVVRGYTCKVLHDDDPMSPDDWDNVGTIYSNSRNYNPQGHTMDEIMVETGVRDSEMQIDPNYLFVRIYAYEHGGIALHHATGPRTCGWDERLFGVMAVHKDKAAKEFGDLTNPDNFEKVMKCLEGEVEDWDCYYQGCVYGYEVLDEDGCVVDSCWGFYDKPEEVLKEAEAAANAIADEVEREAAEEAAHIAYYESIIEPFWID